MAGSSLGTQGEIPHEGRLGIEEESEEASLRFFLPKSLRCAILHNNR